MNRDRADAAVAVILGVVLLGGAALTWQAYRQRRALDQSMGSMMETSMGSMHGPNPLWVAFLTILVAAAIGGVYLLIREELSAPNGERATLESERMGPAEPTATTDQPAASPTPEANPRERVLDLLPDDERRVLEPVLESPGVTQIELRDRSDFSKSKVSQTLSALEERGLLYRERQGRTYRIYPSDDLQQRRPGQ
ncbi:helix-turn-helix transcriptional regulator [Halovivax cerinus]|uniref:Helix-turn-helix transcriptional regulator n=1 Tax=Halovivax cerinus TaxID=1487865 RepID=A0ABD5NR26_9EURY|nr:MarR family transcriptional regulator [Halovivax cerinus]